jgi:hypothetical protein
LHFLTVICSQSRLHIASALTKWYKFIIVND